MDDEARRISSPHLYGALRLLANRCRYAIGWEDGDATCMEAAGRIRELEAQLAAIPPWLRREGGSSGRFWADAIERGEYLPQHPPHTQPRDEHGADHAAHD